MTDSLRCPVCGAANDPADRFCAACGARLHAEPVPREAPAAVAGGEAAPPTGRPAGATWPGVDQSAEPEPAGNGISRPALGGATDGAEPWPSTPAAAGPAEAAAVRAAAEDAAARPAAEPPLPRPTAEDEESWFVGTRPSTLVAWGLMAVIGGILLGAVGQVDPTGTLVIVAFLIVPLGLLLLLLAPVCWLIQKLARRP